VTCGALIRPEGNVSCLLDAGHLEEWHQCGNTRWNFDARAGKGLKLDAEEGVQQGQQQSAVEDEKEIRQQEGNVDLLRESEQVRQRQDESV
jgi:hypothetical protein